MTALLEAVARFVAEWYNVGKTIGGACAMPDPSLARMLDCAHDFQEACCVQVSLFDYATRGFAPEMDRPFCPDCELSRSGRCDHRTAHTYGCFEAERWNGLYVYYCPMSLTFLATAVFEDRRALYALVTGPIVMGQAEDLPPHDMGDAVAALPVKTPKQIRHLSNLQWALTNYLSGRGAEARELAQAQAERHNQLYALTEQYRSGQGTRYPIEIEQRLQKMITQGDKHGAKALINQLLGTLYFSTAGDFPVIKDRAKELIVLFSRASVEGGADVRRIFGLNRDLQDEIDRLQNLDALSDFLTAIFYRFVGYVFDFTQFEHTDILHKAVNYLRENLSEKLTLEDLAAHVGLSRSYLSTIIKSELGMSFTDYLNQMRIDRSKELLLDPKLSLAEIAGLVGYGDQSYFTKKFAQQAGMSPGQYRKKRGKG